MPESEVDLKHMLENTRDSYPCSPEEAIITELVANALDSEASEVRFEVNDYRRILKIEDNGRGMSQKGLIDYHNIASTDKTRGKGIGFAGVGAKLALLYADKVVTETKRGTFHKATSWRLVSRSFIPWEYVRTNGKIAFSHGTSVSIHLRNHNRYLLDENVIRRVIQASFYPILHEEFMNAVLKVVYKKGVRFYVGSQEVKLPEGTKKAKQFLVKLGKRKKPVGIGIVQKFITPVEEEKRGIAISTYGKVIKRGWEWIGIMPNNPTRLTGIVEVPDLSQILLSNKMDFLRDTNSLQKYYRYRKAIQKAITPVLSELGEISQTHEKSEKRLRSLEEEIQRALGNMLDDFP